MKYIPSPMRKGIKQAKINALSFAKLTALMLDGGMTRQEMAEETGLHYVTVLRYCRALRKEGILRIDGWRLDARGRMNIRTYKLGTGPDAKQPIKSVSEIAKDYRARKKMKEMIQRMAG